jgi:YebC/PmpR family DNA-binding regulatory protein
MSGHSKWHNIQARKGKQDAAKSNVFSKLSKLITVATRQGSDPAMNFSLRLAIEKAKSAGMPKDNIDRAVKRGAGETGGVQMEEVLYEAYGPGGVAIIIKGITDNKNRTLQEVKHILSKNGGSLGNAGAVLWMFEQFGFTTVSVDLIESIGRDKFELALIDVGAEDIKNGDENMIEIKTKVENFKKTMDKLKELEIEPKESGLIWEAKDNINVPEDVRLKLENIFSEFEENDDIEDWYTNAE